MLVCSVASNWKSTHGSTKSGPTVPLIKPISGVTTSDRCDPPPPDRPAELRKSVIALTPDQLVGVGPPGAAQSAITARTPARLPDCMADVSIAASCPNAPCGVCGKPVGTPAGPVR